MPRDNGRKHWTRETYSGPAGGPFRTHINPIQFAVNPLGAQNLHGYKARDFSGEKMDPPHFMRAMELLGKMISSKGSQAVRRARRDA